MSNAIQPVKWDRFLWPAAFVSLFLLIVPQAGFIWLSFFEDAGFGQVGQQFTIVNYYRILADPFYIEAIWLTVYLSGIAVSIVILLGFPTAYALARANPRVATFLLSLILATSLITVVIKLLGLNIILGPSGFINGLLLSTGLIVAPLQLINNQAGVVIGLLQYILPLFVLLMFSVVQTVPLQLEEAAEIHGASRIAVFLQVIIPLVRQGMVVSALICFNMSMGAFTSAVLMGGGRVRTLPVLIQQKIIQSSEYALGAALSTSLILIVFVINIAVAIASRRGRSG